jgi:hypothetical protein
VLFTTAALDHRGGSSLYVLDLARALLERGHQPLVWSPRLGEVADELRAATIPVVDDLGSLESTPDLIHAQHQLPAMAALLRFPGVPAVFFCHGWLPWEERPPRFPRIRRYVAVDHTCRDRLLLEAGIPGESVEVVLNFVDLRKFRPRPPLPVRPARALVFSHQASEATHLPAIREACAERGIAVDVIGRDSGRAARRPEDVLPAYDLVFAKARCALEALAVGAAVIPCDALGMGPLVASANLERLRPLNFGVRALGQRIEKAALLREIDAYDAADAGRVSAEVRRTASLDEAADRLVGIYERVLAEGRSTDPSADAREESQAASRYLHALDRDVAAWARLGPENLRLSAENAWLSARSAELERRGADLAREAAVEAARVEALTADRAASAERMAVLEPVRAEYEWMRRSLTWRARSAILRAPALAPMWRFLSRRRG